MMVNNYIFLCVFQSYTGQVFPDHRMVLYGYTAYGTDVTLTV